MQRYIVVRLFQSLVVLFAVTIIIFGLVRVSGSPLDVLVPEEATPEDIEITKRVWGLDKPLHIQYITYLGNIFTGNFGYSVVWQGKSARDLLFERLPATLQLAAFALAVSMMLSLPLGIIAAVNKDKGFDFVAKIVALLGQSLPSFWIGLVLMWIFAVELGWLPTSGRGGIKHMILPSIALGWYTVAAGMRLVRSSMLDILDSEFVKLARVKGLPEWKVVWKHCLRNAALAPLTYFGLLLGGLSLAQ